jgi:hypothetical protein
VNTDDSTVVNYVFRKAAAFADGLPAVTFHLLLKESRMKKIIGLFAVAAVAAAFAGCNNADRASANSTEVKVAGCSGEKACSEGKACSKGEACCNSAKAAECKDKGSCTDKAEKKAMSEGKSCAEKCATEKKN